MKALGKSLRRGEKGFTLPEVLVTIMMMVMVLFALYSIFDMGIRVFAFGNDKVEAVENARLGLQKMEREIRAAYPVDAANNEKYLFFSASGAPANPPPYPPTPTQITFGNELGAGGDGEIKCPSTAGCEYITYRLASSANPTVACTTAPCSLVRNATATGSDISSGGEPVIESVKPPDPSATPSYPGGLKFEYLKDDGAVASAQSDIDRVRITLDISVDGDPPRTQTLSTEVELRNQDIASLPSQSTIDTDGDGTPDATDEDDDGDGIPDASDSCPSVGAATANGCPNDSDGDGTSDEADTDDDGDNVADEDDDCPLVAGDQANGCTMPDTTITNGPPATTSATTASFQFTSSETGSTFECRLDSGGWESCTSSKSYSGLSVGDHTFRVRATNGSGNTDSTPASRAWTIGAPDTMPPDTTITSGPTGTVTATTADFGFTSSENGSTFECRLDSGNWEACASPKSYSGLATGSHTFQVRATDPSGNVDASPASRTWTVAAPNRPPVANNDTASTSQANSVTIDVRANDSDPDNDALTITRVYWVRNGNIELGKSEKGATVTISQGKVVYQPKGGPGGKGTDKFYYEITDNKGGTATALVSVNVT